MNERVRTFKGGFHDITRPGGALVGRHHPVPPRPYDVIEEMYGMIWQLAGKLAESNPWIYQDPAELIEQARLHYKDGLYLSPTNRNREST